MAAQASGPITGADLKDLAAKDELLRQQAAASPVGNMVGATQQLSGSFTPGSPGAQLLQQMQSGQLSSMQPGEWLHAMQASGINPAIAQDTLRQTAANQQVMTPELIDTVRRNQGAIDLNPLVERNMAMLSSPPELREQLRPGVQEQVATQAGYTDWNEANALHGAPAQGVRNMFDYGRQQAQAASQLSGIGTASPLRRVVDCQVVEPASDKP